jgi:hypothetical protein
VPFVAQRPVPIPAPSDELLALIVEFEMMIIPTVDRPCRSATPLPIPAPYLEQLAVTIEFEIMILPTVELLFS